MTNTTHKNFHVAGELINNRYSIIKLLGRGGIGFTFAAQDLQTNQPVALKLLSLKRAADWKKLELFEREAKILSSLNHADIPQYLDYFQIETEKDRSFYIVQQLAPGNSLDKWIEGGWKINSQEIEQFATQLLNIVIYLQELLPPVIHRDIKPQNIIRNQDGKIFLVDFGSVQDTYRQNVTQGSTVVGTFGYMAPEQFRGQAVLSTDLYGIGTTLLFMLTGESPADLPQHRLKIKFHSALPNLDKSFADWLERMIEPKPENRFTTAREALNVLQGKQTLPPPPLENIPKPQGCPIKITKNTDVISIKIPAIGFRTPQIQKFAIATLLVNVFLAFIVSMIVSLQLFISPESLPCFGISVGIGLFFLIKFFYGAFGITKLEINRLEKKFLMDKKLLGSRYQRERNSFGENIELKQVALIKVKQKKLWLWRKIPFTYCSLSVDYKKYNFGGFLSKTENNWLAGEIDKFLQ